MNMTVESILVKSIEQLIDKTTGTRNHGLVYLQLAQEDRCVIRVVSDKTNNKWLVSEIAKKNIYLPVDVIYVQT